jgi:hypothetical protein
VRALLEAGLSAPLDDGEAVLVPAGATEASGPEYRAELSGDLLGFCPPTGDDCFAFRPVDSVFGSPPPDAPSEVTVAYDVHGKRFLLLVAQLATDSMTGAEAARRLALAVAAEEGPQAEWNIALLWDADAASSEVGIGQAEGIVIDSNAVYVLVEAVDPGRNQSRRWVWRIDRGSETSGFYSEGKVQITVY